MLSTIPRQRVKDLSKKKLKDPKELTIEELCDIVTSIWKEEGVIMTPRSNIGNICNAPGILYGLILKCL